MENLKGRALGESFLPAKGIDSPMLKVIEEDGVVLSGGENQKLAIARALYREGARDDNGRTDGCAGCSGGRKDISNLTLFCPADGAVISHRLASTRFCDRIIA